MKEEDSKVIRQNWVYLIGTIDSGALVPYFIEALILSPDDDEAISAAKTQKERNIAFLRMILKKGPKAFATLIYALNQANDAHVAKVLTDGIAEEGILYAILR